MKHYIPQAGSVAAQVCRFFIENPSEELSASDISMKFHTGTATVYRDLQRSVETGLLVRARNADGDQVYGPGPDIDRLTETDNTPTPVNPTTDTTMPAKQLPSKPAKVGKRAAKDVDYSTVYAPQTPQTPAAPRHKPGDSEGEFTYAPQTPQTPAAPPEPPDLPSAPKAQQAAPEAMPVLIDCAPSAPVTTDEPARPGTVMDRLTIVNDAPIFKHTEPYAYHALFDVLPVGNAVRAPTGDVSKVCGAMRNWIFLRGKENELHVKSCPNYAGDAGFGRVWLMAGKSLYPSRKRPVNHARLAQGVNP